jgi:hypothetical protein
MVVIDRMRNVSSSINLIIRPEKIEFELRIVCWRSLDVPCIDNGYGDFFVKVFIELLLIMTNLLMSVCSQFYMEGEDLSYNTDTHWRCKNGSASWNWRIKIPVILPIKTRELGRLHVQV